MTSNRDRAVGCLVGLAVGDALGATLEFSERDSRAPLTDMIGGGPFDLDAGQWTDDTSLALCLAESVLACAGLDQTDLMRRFRRWYREGHNSCTGRCFDIGATTRAAIERYERTGKAEAGDPSPRAAGNGSIMRLAPVAIFWHRVPDEAECQAAAQSRVTHAATEAVDGCVLLARILVAAINGTPKRELFARRPSVLCPRIAAIAEGSWDGKTRREIRSSGYVVDTLEAAIWSVARSDGFDEALRLAVNLGDDADTVGAVTGQIAGALYGLEAIPAQWRERLAWRKRIESLANALLDEAPGP
ncbi:MAG: ADP-ribosylglycohydrolase family protein [Alphaproteobacteria bacterium]